MSAPDRPPSFWVPIVVLAAGAVVAVSLLKFVIGTLFGAIRLVAVVVVAAAVIALVVGRRADR